MLTKCALKLANKLLQTKKILCLLTLPEIFICHHLTETFYLFPFALLLPVFTKPWGLNNTSHANQHFFFIWWSLWMFSSAEGVL